MPDLLLVVVPRRYSGRLFAPAARPGPMNRMLPLVCVLIVGPVRQGQSLAGIP